MRLIRQGIQMYRSRPRRQDILSLRQTRPRINGLCLECRKEIPFIQLIPAARDLVHKLRSRTSRLSVCGCALAGCGKSPPAAFSRHSAAHRTARVRFAPSLAAALLDGHFAHPVACTDAGRHVEPSVRDDAKSEFFRNLLVARVTARLNSGLYLFRGTAGSLRAAR